MKKIILEHNETFDSCVDGELEFTFQNGDKLYKAHRGYNDDGQNQYEWAANVHKVLVPVSGSPKLVYSAICINGRTEEIVPCGYRASFGKFTSGLDELPHVGNYVTEERRGNYVSGGGAVAHKAHGPSAPREYAAMRDTSFIGAFTGRQYSAEYLLAVE